MWAKMGGGYKVKGWKGGGGGVDSESGKHPS